MTSALPRRIMRDYLQRHGVPATAAELVQHRIVGGTAAAVPTAWMFERDGKEEVISLEPHFSTNENEGAIAAAVGTSTSGWTCSRELEDGSLVRLFLGWKMVGIPCTPIFPWVQRRAPPGGRPSTIWSPSSGAVQTSFRPDRSRSDSTPRDFTG